MDDAQTGDTFADDVAGMYRHLTRITRTLRAKAAGSGLSAGGAASLWTIINHAPIRVTTLAEAESVSAPTMSKIVASLVDRGYVERVGDPDDARAKLVQPTPQGRAVIAEMRLVRTRALADALETMSPTDRDTVEAGLRLLSTALAPRLDTSDRPKGTTA
ncbi:MarR family winged helix-turn-helix transcriptional regulator [Gordonia sp. MP11Mi]|uniref:HTH marR-type domain-containing protein n=1 Tax=Gordonia sp. MP11Mi TaxID=3022769 RepID=A0AA97CX97_9ACTN